MVESVLEAHSDTLHLVQQVLNPNRKTQGAMQKVEISGWGEADAPAKPFQFVSAPP